MMQGLRPLNDENSMAHLHRPVLGGGKAGLSEGSGALAAKTPGFQPSARKALGNITNRGGGGLENGPPGKTPAAGAAPRRALGDITNAGGGAGPLRSALRPADKPAAAGPSSCAKPAPAAASAAVASTSSRLDELAGGGVERLAGRGWEELEADREAAADAEISARLEALASLPQRSVPSFFPLWNASLASLERPLALQREAAPSPPPSPASPLRSSSLASLEAPELDAPIELPELGGTADMDLDLVLFDDGRSDASGGSGGRPSL